MRTYNRVVYVEGSATTTDQTYAFDAFDVNRFVNDGTDAIYVNFGISTAGAGTITVKASETFSAPLRCVRFTVRAKTGTQAFRAVGLADPN